MFDFLIFLALIVSLLILILLIRFLWMVPNSLRELSQYLRRLSFIFDVKDDDVDDFDPKVVESIERETAEKFINSSTLR
ncbi:MAG: hypothetical protein IKB95_09265 [Bacteroidales bacterium]|nr:hypothetical protein [Bacteroidales bacterium]